MKRSNAAILIVIAVPFLFLAGGCKKNKTPQVYFTASTVTVPANGTATVSISLSQASDNVVGVQFQSIGTSKIDFGTTASSFMHDDSDKMQASIDANGYIDAAGHIQITPGATSVLVSFTERNDNFPHAPGNFEIQMTAAQNATVRSGSNTFTYNTNASQVTEQFASSISFTDSVNVIYGQAYSLQSYTYTPTSGTAYNTSTTYDLTLNYATGVATGPTTIAITYSNMNPFALGKDTVNCSNATISAVLGYSTPVNLSCSNFSKSNTILPVAYSTTPGVYGNYFVFNNGSVPLNNVTLASPNYLITGSLGSACIFYTQ